MSFLINIAFLVEKPLLLITHRLLNAAFVLRIFRDLFSLVTLTFNNLLHMQHKMHYSLYKY